MSLPFYAVDFRGHPACLCLAAWLPVYEHELQRRGILTGPLHIYQLIGTASASASTHSQGGAFDLLDLPGDMDVWVARQMGADATWTRPEGWDGGNGIRHNHGVLRGCPHNAPARYQIDAVDAGFDGLGHLGRGGPDTGPRPLSGRTWRQGVEWARAQEDDMPSPKDWTAEDWSVVDAHLDARLAAFGRQAGDLIKVTNSADPKKPKWSLSTALTSLYKRTAPTKEKP